MQNKRQVFHQLNNSSALNISCLTQKPPQEVELVHLPRSRLGINMSYLKEKSSCYNFPFTNAASLIAGNPFDCHQLL